MCLRATQWFEHWHSLQRLAPHIEDDRVPRRRCHLVGVLRETPTAEVRPGVRRRLSDSAIDLGVSDDAFHPATRNQPVVEALLLPHVAVLKVDEHQLVRVPVEALTIAIALQQLELRDPVELTR